MRPTPTLHATGGRRLFKSGRSLVPARRLPGSKTIHGRGDPFDEDKAFQRVVGGRVSPCDGSCPSGGGTRAGLTTVPSLVLFLQSMDPRNLYNFWQRQIGPLKGQYDFRRTRDTVFMNQHYSKKQVLTHWGADKNERHVSGSLSFLRSTGSMGRGAAWKRNGRGHVDEETGHLAVKRDEWTGSRGQRTGRVRETEEASKRDRQTGSLPLLFYSLSIRLVQLLSVRAFRSCSGVPDLVKSSDGATVADGERSLGSVRSTVVFRATAFNPSNCSTLCF